MSFFKDFKEDLSQAVSELMPEEEKKGNVLNLDPEPVLEPIHDMEEAPADEGNAFSEGGEQLSAEAADFNEIEEIPNEGTEKTMEEIQMESALDTAKEVEEMRKALNELVSEEEPEEVMEEEDEDEEGENEVTTISKGVYIEGNLRSNGSVELLGSITGNVECRGKLMISGSITGNPKASEIYANEARIEGNVSAEGSVKVGNGSVVIGNLSATSAVIAGAVKGDIDVHGPVIVDSTAVIVGNINSCSVELKLGAVLDGVVSQCYSGVNVEEIFAAQNQASTSKAKKVVKK